MEHNPSIPPDGARAETGNPLGYERVSKLLPRFAVPSVVGMLTGALYNIVDQLFIGNRVGLPGIAATNVDLPVATVALAAALLFGIGGAARFSLLLGQGKKEEAAGVVGNALLWMGVLGCMMLLGMRLFLPRIVTALGATEEVLPYSLAYSGTVAWGLPVAVLSIGMTHLIRADGSPGYAMLCTVVGCLTNVALDATLMFGFDMGVEGAAWATVAAQTVSFLMGALYMLRYKSAPLTRARFRPHMGITFSIMAVGAASCFNQLAMSVVQTVLNNTLTHYGELSHYGAEAPLAAVGVIMKVNMIFLSVVIGVSQGCQPIIGFNYGAKRYDRVREALKLAIWLSSLFSLVSFLCYQLFPGALVAIFGSKDAQFDAFAVRCFRIYLMLAFLSGIQPVVSNFFASIGKAIMGIFISLTRQFLFFLPLILIFPRFWGIDGVLYAGPAADVAAFGTALVLVLRELRRMKTAEMALNG